MLGHPIPLARYPSPPLSGRDLTAPSSGTRQRKAAFFRSVVHRRRTETRKRRKLLGPSFSEDAAQGISQSMLEVPSV
jgi:hypothetical protein